MARLQIFPMKPTADRWPTWLIGCLLATALLIPGCTSPDEGADQPVSASNPIRIVATTSMIADLVSRVGGETVEVEGLMGPGVDPHLYQASEGDVTALTGADLVFYNGLHLEGKMVEIFEQMQGRGMDVHAVTEGMHHEDLLSSELFSGSHDPHIWFDPGLWQRAAMTVGSILAAHDTLHADAYMDAARDFAGDIDSLAVWARSELSRIPDNNRVLITSHDAFGYFGRAFDLDVRGLQGISTALEAGTADVRELARFVAERRIPSLFMESSISPRGIEAVRAAVRDRGFDVRIGGTLYGDALGPVGSGAETYESMFRSNINTIVAGLSDTP